MKHLFIGSIAAILLGCAGSDDIPPAARAAFEKKFPNATNVDWEKQKDGFLEANFEQDSKHNSATFYADGRIKEIEIEITEAALPAPVRQHLKSKYATTSIKAVSMITTSKGKIIYEAEINGRELFFDSYGNLRNITSAEKEDKN